MVFRIAAALVGCAFIGFYFLALNDPELFEKLHSSTPQYSSPHFIPLIGLLFLAYAYKGRKLEGYGK